MLNIAVEAENKKTLPATFEILASLQKQAYRSGKSSIQIIKDKVIPMMTVFSMEPFHPFFEEFYLQTKRLIESGTMKFNEDLRIRRYDEEIPALMLTMTDLGIGFTACLIPLALGAIAFVVEVAIPKAKIFANKILEMIMAVFVVKAFLRAQAN